MLTTEERDNLVKYKLERARETWNEIVGIVDGGYWYAAANRMYYACYYVTSALLVKNGIQANTHSGVIRMLGLHFVSTNIISDEMGSFYTRLFELRQTGDYDEWKVIKESDIKPLMPKVEEYMQCIISLINSKD
jgi:uncharacterized protein (UPF0332 family)